MATREPKYRIALTLAQLVQVGTLLIEQKNRLVGDLKQERAIWDTYAVIDDAIGKVSAGAKKADTNYVPAELRIRAEPVSVESLGLVDELIGIGKAGVMPGELSDAEKLANMSPEESDALFDKLMKENF